jgi:hypothetical protein
LKESQYDEGAVTIPLANNSDKLTTKDFCFSTYRGFVHPGTLFSAWFEFLDLIITHLLHDTQQVHWGEKQVEYDTNLLSWDKLTNLGLEDIYLLVTSILPKPPLLPLKDITQYDDSLKKCIDCDKTESWIKTSMETWDHIILLISPSEMKNFRDVFQTYFLPPDQLGQVRLWLLIKQHYSNHYLSFEHWNQWQSDNPMFQIDQSFRYMVETSDHQLMDLSQVKVPDELIQPIEHGKVGFLAFGEPWITSLKQLRIPGIIWSSLRAYITKTWAGDFESLGPRWFWIPKHFAIEEHIQFYTHPEFTLNHITNYGKQHGLSDTTPSIEQLYNHQGSSLYDFFSPYDEHLEFDNTITSILPLNPPLTSTEQLLNQRKVNLQTYLSCRFGVSYRWTMEPLDPSPLDKSNDSQGLSLHPTTPQQAISVDWVELPVDKLGTIHVQSNNTFHHSRFFLTQTNQVSLWSNWLFFLTPRVIQRYNRALAYAGGTTGEQIKIPPSHLDFCFDPQFSHNQQFPLFPKAMVYQESNGRLGITKGCQSSGRITIFYPSNLNHPRSLELSWTFDQIISKPCLIDELFLDIDWSQQVLLITPGWYDSQKDYPVNRFVPKSIGSNRLNLVIVGGTITAIRLGPVFLPPFGIVLSVDPQALPQDLFDQIQCDGLFAPDHWSFKLKLDNPTELSNQQWESLHWAYGGAYTLIYGGRPSWNSSIEEEQWNHICSKASQESDLSLDSRHPRTALSINSQGNAKIWVFAGRSFVSPGVTYKEMTDFILQKDPDVQYAVNLDGGASSFLGLSEGSSFYELSMPVFTYDSCTGRARPVFSSLEMTL